MINEKMSVAGVLPLALVLFVISTTQANPLGFWSMNPIKTPQLFAIALEGVYPQNRSFLYQNITVNVDTTIPALYTSGEWNYPITRKVLTYCSWYVFQNSTQEIILNSTPTNMTNATYTATFVFNPKQPGTYAIGDVCKSSTSIFNTYTGSWSAWSAPSIIAQDVKVINVVFPASIGPFQRLAIDINTFLSNILYGIINAVEKFFGIFKI